MVFLFDECLGMKIVKMKMVVLVMIESVRNVVVKLKWFISRLLVRLLSVVLIFMISEMVFCVKLKCFVLCIMLDSMIVIIMLKMLVFMLFRSWIVMMVYGLFVSVNRMFCIGNIISVMRNSFFCLILVLIVCLIVVVIMIIMSCVVIMYVLSYCMFLCGVFMVIICFVSGSMVVLLKWNSMIVVSSVSRLCCLNIFRIGCGFLVLFFVCSILLLCVIL